MGEIEVVVQLATTGEHLITLKMAPNDTVAKLRSALSRSGFLAEGSNISLVFGAANLDDCMTLSEVGFQSGHHIVTLLRHMQEIQVFHLSAWDKGYRGNRALALSTVSVPVASANHVVEAVVPGEAGWHLIEIGRLYVRMVDPQDFVLSYDWLEVAGSGLATINGNYLRDGHHLGFPRWRRHGFVIAHHGGEGVWLRKGSDGNWCIVNNADGELDASNKKYFYLSSSPEITSDAWRHDAHGEEPAPSVSRIPAPIPHGYPAAGEDNYNMHEQLFQHIKEHGRAFVVVPPLDDNQRVIVMHVQHFHDETLIYAKVGYVGCESFAGMDDEQIGILDGNTESGAALFQYIGK